MRHYEKGDTVEVTAQCAWTGEVGIVAAWIGPSLYVKLDHKLAIPFVVEDVRPALHPDRLPRRAA